VNNRRIVVSLLQEIHEMMKKIYLLGALVFSVLALLPIALPAEKVNDTFKVGDKTFLLNGKPFVVKAAELHYPRIPRAYWDQRIKMCKALGMNTLCLYVFWNIHEQQEGKFDFTGNNDVAAFCRLAQKNGMYVIVRPGPYVCAEWEMGGLPWWLLKKKNIRLREEDPYFMERVRLFETEVGRQLATLTIQHGGPIIMVQVENEYGSYGENKPYVSAIRDIVRASGFNDVTLFQCDWSSNFTKNGLDDLVWTMNFGTGANIDEQFKKLSELRPNAPKMCSEFWSGWFDKWGARHETRPAKEMVNGIDEMLSKGISFSLYMTHGGTTFGHWAGSNSPGFAPDVTSYDYDAPINEYGRTTPKFFELRQVMQKYSKTKLSEIPKLYPIIKVPKFKVNEFVPFSTGIVKTVENRDVMMMEDLDMGWGSIIYETLLPATDGKSLLTLDEPHDYAQVLINGKYVGKIDRVKNERTLILPATKKGDQLTIVVEAMGRINFGRGINDYKGITRSVTLSGELDGDEVTYHLKNWKMSTIPDDYQTAVQAFAKKCIPEGRDSYFAKAGYYRGYFNLRKTGDTFLNMETWEKGQVYVNGHAIGRFWNIGPQQTLYLPGCWLKKGSNEVIVLDLVGPRETECEGLEKPELNKLNLETVATHRLEGETLDVSTLPLALKGTFTPGNGWQNIRFNGVQKGRYVAVEALNAYDGKDQAAIAELYVLDENGKRLNREAWTVKYADSEDADNGNKTADKTFDLQESTYWSTVAGKSFPHVMVIDLGSEQQVSGVEYLPRAEEGAPAGIKDYKIYVY